MRSKLSRRTMLKAAPALALTPGFLTATRGRVAAQEGDLTVWAMGAEGEKLPTLAEDYMAEFPDVAVEVTPVPWNQAHQKLLTSIAGGGLPDISMAGTTWMAEFVETGATLKNQSSASPNSGSAATAHQGGARSKPVALGPSQAGQTSQGISQSTIRRTLLGSRIK